MDVDAENRAVVIDYKHRTGVEEFKLADPTVRDEESGTAPIDDPRWLPPHTQTLIYAQAMRRALDLDTRAALYFSTKGGKPALRGAASAELLEEERGDGRIPGLKKGFPARVAAWTSTPCSIAWRPASPSACASSRQATLPPSTRCRLRPRMRAARITTKERL